MKTIFVPKSQGSKRRNKIKQNEKIVRFNDQQIDALSGLKIKSIITGFVYLFIDAFFTCKYNERGF